MCVRVCMCACVSVCVCVCVCSCRLLYVVTVDGSVTVISEYGQVRWEYQTGMPLFHSSLNQYKVGEHLHRET